MTVTITATFSGPYTGTGATDQEFPVTFQSAGPNEIAVTLDGVTISPNSYAFARDDDGRGTVVATLAGEVYISSAPSFTQNFDFQRQGPYFPDDLNAPLDHAVIRDLYLLDQIGRGILVPLGETGFALSPAVLAVLQTGSFPTTVGGDASAVGPFGAFSTYTIPVGHDRVSTSGAVTSGDGGDGSYVLDTGQSAITARGAVLKSWGVANGLSGAAAEAAIVAAERRFRRAEGGGRYFTLSGNSARAECLRLAADSDASWIQGVLDYISCWQGHAEFGPGIFNVDTSLFLTRGFVVDGGDTYSTGRLTGAGRGFFGAEDFRGTELVFSATDRPGLIAQGGRHVVIEEVGLTGPLKDYILDNALGTQTSLLDETIESVWAAEERWAVNAAIAIDPLYGAAPADPYPDLGDPDWIGTQALYGRTTTSVVEIDRVNITGWPVGIAVHPSAGAPQSDFVTFAHGNIECCKWGLSVGNSQSRQTEIHLGRLNRGYCAFNNRHIGDEGGEIAVSFPNVSVGAHHKVFDFLLQLAGEISFDSLKVEQTLLLGELRNGGSTDPTLRLTSAQCSLWTAGLASRTGAWPFIVGNSDDPARGNSTSNLVLVDSTLLVRELCPLMVGSLRCEGLNIVVSTAQADAPSVARAMAQNGTLGLVTPAEISGGGFSGLVRGFPHVVKGQIYDLDDGSTPSSLGTTRTDSRHRDTSRQTCIPYWLQRAVPKNHLDDLYAVPVPAHARAVAKSSFTFGGTPVVGRTLSMTGASGGDENDARYHCQAPGRVFLDTQSGIWWYVESWNYTTGAVVAKALCGYRDLTGVNDGANDTLYLPWNATGSFIFVETGFYTPVEVLIGDTTSGNAVISNVRNPSGDTDWFVDQIELGDFLWVDPNDPAPLFPLTGFKNKVVSVDDGAFEITMNGNATATTTGTRFTLWQRQI